MEFMYASNLERLSFDSTLYSLIDDLFPVHSLLRFEDLWNKIVNCQLSISMLIIHLP